MSASKNLIRLPLAFGMTRWGPLPGTEDIYIFWGGPDDGLYLTKGEQHVLQKRITHPAAAGIYATVQEAQQAVDAFVGAGQETSS